MGRGVVDTLRNGGMGLIVGTDLVLRTVALALLFFAGALQAFAVDAIGIFLAATLIFTVGGLLRFGFPMGLSLVRSEVVAVLIPVVGVIGAAGLSAEAAGATGFAIIGLTSVLSGLALWTVIYFRLERFARMMPHAVVVGFIAATGALLIIAAMDGLAPALWGRGLDAPGTELTNLSLGLVVAAAMWIGARLSPQSGAILVILAALVCFYVWMGVSGMTFVDAQSRDLLLNMAVGQPDYAHMVTSWTEVRWNIIWEALPLMAAATMVCVLALLLTVSGLETLLRQDAPLTKMLRTLGPLNIIIGGAGGGAGFPSLASVSAVAQGHDTPPRDQTIAPVMICAVLFLALVQVDLILAYTPTFLASAMLIYVGFGIIWSWLVLQFYKLSLPDWLIAFGIVVVSVVLGILTAIGVGIVVAALIFVVMYARLPMIRSQSTLAVRRSTVDRDETQMAYLDWHGRRVVILSVQGFLFFGTIDALVRRMRAIAEDATGVLRLILDFKHVTGIDGAALEALRKLEYALDDPNLRIVIVGASPSVARDLTHSGVGIDTERFDVIPGALDDALERAEEVLLREAELAAKDTDARAALAAYFDVADVEALLERMTRLHLEPGDVLIASGSEEQDIYLINSGRLGVFTGATPQDRSGERLRVRALRPGTFVGEIAGYLDQTRTADVIAEAPSAVYRTQTGFLEKLEEEAPHLAAQWHRMMAKVLAERVQRTNRLLQDLAG